MLILNPRKIFEQCNAIQKGHFQLHDQNLHSDTYLNKKALTEEALSDLCWIIVEKTYDLPISVVIGPESGGIVLSELTAEHLSRSTRKPVSAITAWKTADGKSLYLKDEDVEKICNKTILIVEDILTTGSSVRNTVHAVQKAGGYIAGIVGLWNRNHVHPTDIGNVPSFFCLINDPVPSWQKKKCPLCAQGIPLDPKPR